MTTPPTPNGPVLRLPRRQPAPPSVTGAAPESPAEQALLREDWASLRERELNLRAYEERLRAWQAELDAARGITPPPAPVATHAPAETVSEGLQSGWEKLHRARQLLEAEQTHIRDGRALMREAEAALQQREKALAVREARVAAREEELSSLKHELEAMKHELATLAAGMPSPIRRLTQAPFQAARAVFGGSK